MNTSRQAVALISGGLDSMLAVRVIQEQGIYVEGINFYTGFCVEGHTHAIRNKDRKKPKRNSALWCAEQLGIKLHIIDIIQEYKNILLNPHHGYGANLNPCLDCKAFMVAKAREWMEQHGFDFIITGEVVGQRPKSQRKETLPVVARESGAGDRLLRPLCAGLLTQTLPEQEGWVDRAQLHSFSGRSRKPQIQLAQSYGFDEWSQPAGGCCFLTDENYSRKLKDLWNHRGERDYELDDIMLLKVGRHLRPASHYKLIVARDEGESRFLQGYQKTFITLSAISHPGPLCLVEGDAGEEELELAARVVARFGQGRDSGIVTIELTMPGERGRSLEVRPMKPEEVPKGWYL
jgi:tRNA U34 2-thiouridine synthase MnmA/TrmU